VHHAIDVMQEESELKHERPPSEKEDEEDE
jgi:hypothetical protein